MTVDQPVPGAEKWMPNARPTEEALEQALLVLIRNPNAGGRPRSLEECIRAAGDAFSADDVRGIIDRLADAGTIRVEPHPVDVGGDVQIQILLRPV
jgi:hypothetical protein